MVASYPFDDSRNPPSFSTVYSAAPDDAVFKRLATIYASQHATMKTGHVCPGDNFQGGITNGAKWYDESKLFQKTRLFVPGSRIGPVQTVKPINKQLTLDGSSICTRVMNLTGWVRRVISTAHKKVYERVVVVLCMQFHGVDITLIR